MIETNKAFYWISIFGDEPQPAEVTFVAAIPAQAFLIGFANPVEACDFSLVKPLENPARA